MVALLLENGANIEARDGAKGRTSLALAAEESNEAMALLLLKKGADVKSVGKDGRKPLARAAENGHESVVRLLLEKGASVEFSGKSKVDTTTTGYRSGTRTDSEAAA